MDQDESQVSVGGLLSLGKDGQNSAWKYEEFGRMIEEAVMDDVGI